MNQAMQEQSFKDNRNQAERELIDARAHFNDTLREVSEASERVVERVWKHGKPLLFGTALLAAGVAVLLITRNSGARRPLLQIRMVAPPPSRQKAWIGLAAQLALGLLTRHLREQSQLTVQTPHLEA